VNAACAVATPSVKALPLSVAVGRIGGADGGWVVAAGCTDGTVRLYELVSNDGAHDFDAPPTVRLMPLSTLGGHSGWVTALDFEASTGESGGALLVSASQDSTARVWRLRAAPQETQPHAQDGGNDASDASAAVSLGASLGLSSRDFAMSAAFSICGGGMACEAGLDGVLEGHRDWVTSARLRRGRVLTASGDRTVTLWAKREHSIGGAAWVSEASLGEAEVVSNLQGFYGARVTSLGRCSAGGGSVAVTAVMAAMMVADVSRWLGRRSPAAAGSRAAPQRWRGRPVASSCSPPALTAQRACGHAAAAQDRAAAGTKSHGHRCTATLLPPSPSHVSWPEAAATATCAAQRRRRCGRMTHRRHS